MKEKPLLIRCSSLGALITEPKLKADKESGNLSETAKGMVLELWLQKKFGYKERVMTDAMMKGLLCEQDSMALVQSVLGGEFRVKNKPTLYNDFICGTPDLVLKSGVVEDIKTSENLRTFVQSDIDKGYVAQLQGYMALTGLKKARLIYCLVPTPIELVENKKKSLYFKFECNESNPDYIEMCEQIEHNNFLISGIDKKHKVKVFEIERDQEMIDLIYLKVEKAREYFNELKL